MANQTKTFGLNVHRHEGCDCDDAHLELENLVEDFGPIVGSILTPNGPSASKKLQHLVTCMGKQNLHGSFSTHHELETMGPSLHVVFPLAYFCDE
jgi:hypothetical protein